VNRTLFVAENVASSRTKDDEEDKYKLFAKAWANACSSAAYWIFSSIYDDCRMPYE